MGELSSKQIHHHLHSLHETLAKCLKCQVCEWPVPDKAMAAELIKQPAWQIVFEEVPN